MAQAKDKLYSDHDLKVAKEYFPKCQKRILYGQRVSKPGVEKPEYRFFTASVTDNVPQIHEITNLVGRLIGREWGNKKGTVRLGVWGGSYAMEARNRLAETLGYIEFHGKPQGADDHIGYGEL